MILWKPEMDWLLSNSQFGHAKADVGGSPVRGIGIALTHNVGSQSCISSDWSDKSIYKNMQYYIEEHKCMYFMPTVSHCIGLKINWIIMREYKNVCIQASYSLLPEGEKWLEYRLAGQQADLRKNRQTKSRITAGT